MRHNAFGILKNRWTILKKINVRVNQASKIILACYTLHNFCQLQGMPKLVVHDVKPQEIVFWVLLICIYSFHEKVKKLRLLVKRCEMHYLNLEYNIILESRFTFCYFM